jgi:hypothetical protein
MTKFWETLRTILFAVVLAAGSAGTVCMMTGCDDDDPVEDAADDIEDAADELDE